MHRRVLRRSRMSAGLACFSVEVLTLYRRRDDCVLRRTPSAGHLETPRWSLRFRLTPGDALQLPERELWRLDPGEMAHWNSFRLADWPTTWPDVPGVPADGPERPWD